MYLLAGTIMQIQCIILTAAALLNASVIKHITDTINVNNKTTVKSNYYLAMESPLSVYTGTSTPHLCYNINIKVSALLNVLYLGRAGQIIHF